MEGVATAEAVDAGLSCSAWRIRWVRSLLPTLSASTSAPISCACLADGLGSRRSTTPVPLCWFAWSMPAGWDENRDAASTPTPHLTAGSAAGSAIAVLRLIEISRSFSMVWTSIASKGTGETMAPGVLLRRLLRRPEDSIRLARFHSRDRRRDQRVCAASTIRSRFTSTRQPVKTPSSRVLRPRAGLPLRVVMRLRVQSITVCRRHDRRRRRRDAVDAAGATQRYDSYGDRGGRGAALGVAEGLWRGAHEDARIQSER